MFFLLELAGSLSPSLSSFFLYRADRDCPAHFFFHKFLFTLPLSSFSFFCLFLSHIFRLALRNTVSLFLFLYLAISFSHTLATVSVPPSPCSAVSFSLSCMFLFHLYTHKQTFFYRVSLSLLASLFTPSLPIFPLQFLFSVCPFSIPLFLSLCTPSSIQFSYLLHLPAFYLCLHFHPPRFPLSPRVLSLVLFVLFRANRAFTSCAARSCRYLLFSFYFFIYFFIFFLTRLNVHGRIFLYKYVCTFSSLTPSFLYLRLQPSLRFYFPSNHLSLPFSSSFFPRTRSVRFSPPSTFLLLVAPKTFSFISPPRPLPASPLLSTPSHLLFHFLYLFTALHPREHTFSLILVSSSYPSFPTTSFFFSVFYASVDEQAK